MQRTLARAAFSSCQTPNSFYGFRLKDINSSARGWIMKKLQLCLVCFSLLVLVLGASAQVQNGQFSGTISDPSGAAIAGARVTVTNLGTNLSVTTTSSDTGLYAAK